MTTHENYERVSENDFWKLTICPKCGALVLKYQTKEGSSMSVDVLEDWTYQRWGNHYNFVHSHECGARHSNIKQPLFVNVITPTEEVTEKVKGYLQQQAVMKCLTEFAKPRIKSKFKKAMLEQARKFLAGESQFKNAFSPKQAICILGDSITNIPKSCKVKINNKKSSVTLEYKYHVMKFKDGTVLTIDDATRKAELSVKLQESEGTVKLDYHYWQARETLLENLDDPEYTFQINHSDNTIIYIDQ